MLAQRYGHDNISFTQLVQRLVGLPEDQADKVFTAVIAEQYGLCPNKKNAYDKQAVGGLMPQSTLDNIWDARTYETTNLVSPKHVFTPGRSNPLIESATTRQTPNATSSYYDKYMKGSDNKKDN